MTSKNSSSNRIVLTGASGLIGGMLRPFLAARGHRVEVLVRRPPKREEEICWIPSAGKIDAVALEGAEALVHLSGENLAVRWTAERKRRFLESRVKSTQVLCWALAGLTAPPKVLVAASAIGFYGDRGDEILTEESSPGDGFLAEICKPWEEATARARDAGIRVVNLRIGVVLSAKGGALAKVLTPFKLGLGGRVGSGRQWMSWISAEDMTRIIHECIVNSNLSGPVNAVGPNPVTQQEFASTLAKVLQRRALLPMPGFAVRLVFGEMGRTLLLGSTRVLPARLTASRFTFTHPTLESALRSELAGRDPLR